MASTIEEIRDTAAKRMCELVKTHQGSSALSVEGHISMRRRQLVERAAGKRLIYLDTLAWKCLADVRYGDKPRITDAMREFSAAMERVQRRGDNVFPIGGMTFFELNAMTHSDTHQALLTLCDEISDGLCVATPVPTILCAEIARLSVDDFESYPPRDLLLCSPMDLLGITTWEPPDVPSKQFDRTAILKANFDLYFEMPFSRLLALSREFLGARWNNASQTSSLNTGKAAHQEEVPTLNTGIFLELKGAIEAAMEILEVQFVPRQVAILAGAAMLHWKDNPASGALSFLRSRSTIEGLMRFDKQRKYRDGDSADFSTAASALAVAEAFFTDRHLAGILGDSRLGLRSIFPCEVVCGFEEMAAWLDAH